MLDKKFRLSETDLDRYEEVLRIRSYSEGERRNLESRVYG